MNVLDSFDMKGKVSLVTGGARTLGYDAASALAEAGSDLVITSRDEARARAAAEKLGAELGVEVLALALDVRRYEEVEKVAERATAWKGRLDVLVNNAGGGSNTGSCNLFERPPQDIENMIATNLLGTIYCCKAFGKRMAERRQGKIINIASMAGLIGRDRRMYERNGMQQQPTDYAAAKAGVIGFTRDCAAFMAPMGLHVNSISPGGFERGQPAGFIRDYSDRTPLGRMGRDKIDLKGAVLFLASAASDYVTGENLVVDGGFTIWH